MCGLSAFAKRLNIQNCVNSMRNCVHYMYEFSGFTEKPNSANTFNALNCVNLTGNCVHLMYGLSGLEEN